MGQFWSFSKFGIWKENLKTFGEDEPFWTIFKQGSKRKIKEFGKRTSMTLSKILGASKCKIKFS